MIETVLLFHIILICIHMRMSIVCPPGVYFYICVSKINKMSSLERPMKNVYRLCCTLLRFSSLKREDVTRLL